MGSIKIDIKNCNNIVQGSLTLEVGKLNIKYGMNGTGKSTIAKALNAEGKGLEELKTFGADEEPNINISSNMGKVLIFNEDFVNDIVFKEDEVIKNSFEVFIKTPDYDIKRMELDNRVKALKVDISSNGQVGGLKSSLENFKDKLTLTDSKKDVKITPYLKSILKRENLYKVPLALSKYSPFIADDEVAIGWIDWKTKGEQYDQKGLCPFCSEHFQSSYEQEREVFKNTYKKVDAQKLKDMLDYFKQIELYIEPERYNQICDCIKKDTDEESIKVLIRQVTIDTIYLRDKIDNITKFDSNVFKDIEIKEIDTLINQLYIQKANLNIFRSTEMLELVDFINIKIEQVSKEVGKLKADMSRLRKVMSDTVKNCKTDINNFLVAAGINYEVSIDIISEGETRTILRYKDQANTYEVDKIRNHLSWGERNAFALVLFMYYSTSLNPGLIVLDDPISSFDYNKKYAIIHRLFAKPVAEIKRSFYRKTVLMLTHDFEPIIDFIVVKKLDCVRAAYIKNNGGNLLERDIQREDIRPLLKELIAHIKNDKLNMVHRITFLRKYYEHMGLNDEGVAYDMLSSLIHGRKVATHKDGEGLNVDDVEASIRELEQYIFNFNYNELIEDYFNEESLVQYYFIETNSYLKLQIFRALMEIVTIDGVKRDDPLMKFINESYHIENDYVYYLNLLEFDIIPAYIMNKIDKYMKAKYDSKEAIR